MTKKTKFVDVLGQEVAPWFGPQAYWGGRYTQRYPCELAEIPHRRRAIRSGVRYCHECYSKTLCACCELAFEVDA
jgi:hypothetical protein